MGVSLRAESLARAIASKGAAGRHTCILVRTVNLVPIHAMVWVDYRCYLDQYHHGIDSGLGRSIFCIFDLGQHRLNTRCLLRSRLGCHILQLALLPFFGLGGVRNLRESIRSGHPSHLGVSLRRTLPLRSCSRYPRLCEPPIVVAHRCSIGFD